jgi:hypothetical protein
MTREAQFVADSVEAMLVGIAEGVRDAQEALNAIPAIDAFGRPLPTYHLPFLDFTIAVSVTTETTAGRPFIRLTTPAPGSRSTELSSTLSGRLVASPPGEGLPVAQLALAVQSSGNAHKLRITAANSAGEILGNQRIELNVDLDASAALSGLPKPGPGAPVPARLKDAIVITNDAGTAETELTFDAGAPARATIVVTALLGSARASAAVVRP